jgi:hypothetical protein
MSALKGLPSAREAAEQTAEVIEAERKKQRERMAFDIRKAITAAINKGARVAKGSYSEPITACEFAWRDELDAVVKELTDLGYSVEMDMGCRVLGVRW